MDNSSVTLFGVLNALAIFCGIVGLPLALYLFYIQQRDRRVKRLVYSPSASFALATVHNNRYSISIIYERQGEPARNIKAAYTSYVEIISLGRETIRREDIADKDPLRLKIEDVDLLDVVLDGVTRDTINFQLGSVFTKDRTTVIAFDFDFLDHRDGGRIRILSEQPLFRARAEERRSDLSSQNSSVRLPKVSLLGTIIGMDGDIISWEPYGDVATCSRVFKLCLVALCVPVFTVLANFAANYFPELRNFKPNGWQTLLYALLYFGTPIVLSIRVLDSGYEKKGLKPLYTPTKPEMLEASVNPALPSASDNLKPPNDPTT